MAQKTYWHLLDKRRMPTDYEVCTSKLLYYPGGGFEVSTPVAGWYARHQGGSPLVCSDWERFADPRETTYAGYVKLQKAQETHVAGLLESIETGGYDARLPAGCIDALVRVLPVLRYPFHGFQMIAAYVGQMAPSGRITVAALFQAADELRRVQRIAYRMALLRQHHEGFGADAKTRWETLPAWQPLRRAVEELLVTYDWAEAFVGLNLCVKPLVDELFMVHFGELARREGDYLLGEVLWSFQQDCRWHRRWSAALVRAVIDDAPGSARVLQAFVDRWYPAALRATAAWQPLFGASALERTRDEGARGLEDLGLSVPSEGVEGS